MKPSSSVTRFPLKSLEGEKAKRPSGSALNACRAQSSRRGVPRKADSMGNKSPLPCSGEEPRLASSVVVKKGAPAGSGATDEDTAADTMGVISPSMSEAGKLEMVKEREKSKVDYERRNL